MSGFYGEQHRQFQDTFGTRALADREEQIIIRQQFDDTDRAFIGSQSMFFLSTVDHLGRPTVSYKGGAPGMVRVVGEQTLIFPSYDGNGMFLSIGNAQLHPEIGLLFISFERPNRLRVQGRATVSLDSPWLAHYPEAQAIVEVAVSDIWLNCNRYIHRATGLEVSRYVPQEHAQTPLAQWKRIDAIQDVLPADAAAQVQEVGTVTFPEWFGKVQSGDKDA